MCSLLQEHLFESGDGQFTIGAHIRLELAPQVRSRVRSRVYHIVPSSASVGASHSVRKVRLADPIWKGLFPSAIRIKCFEVKTE